VRLTGQRTHGGDSKAIDEEVRESLAQGQSLYTLDPQKLAELAPDVILTQDLCSVCSIDVDSVRRAVQPRDVEDVRGAGLTVRSSPTIVSLNPTDLFGMLDDVLTVGSAVGRERAAEDTMVHLRDRYWRAVDYVNPYVPGPEVAFLEWLDPIFIGGHWTPQLIEAAGPTAARSSRRSSSPLRLSG
jgi:iron complex transport system substrate-binding protein